MSEFSFKEAAKSNNMQVLMCALREAKRLGYGGLEIFFQSKISIAISNIDLNSRVK